MDVIIDVEPTLCPYWVVGEDHRIDSSHILRTVLLIWDESDLFIYFLIFNSPTAEKRTAIVCMMGIVPVQVVGSVRPNEFLYASSQYPGMAVSGYHLSLSEKKDAAMVGVAFSSRVTKNENSVSVLLNFDKLEFNTVFSLYYPLPRNTLFIEHLSFLTPQYFFFLEIPSS